MVEQPLLQFVRVNLALSIKHLTDLLTESGISLGSLPLSVGRRQDAAIIGPGPAHPHEHLTPGHLGVNLGVIRQRGELLT